MNETQTQPVAKPQPLRLNLQCSIIIESEDEAKAILEEIATFIKGVNPTSNIFGSITKLLTPCCEGKKT